MIPFLLPSLTVRNLPLPGGGGLDFILATLIGLIDGNPLLDLVLTPLSWALIFFR